VRRASTVFGVQHKGATATGYEMRSNRTDGARP